MLPQHLKERDIATLYVNKNGQLVVMPKQFLIIVKHSTCIYDSRQMQSRTKLYIFNTNKSQK